jgi:DNA-binding IclR family transcriptional regulator
MIQRLPQILDLLAKAKDDGWISSRDVAEALDITPAHAHNLLRGYQRQGLLMRRDQFKLGEGGRKKLAWLIEQKRAG